MSANVETFDILCVDDDPAVLNLAAEFVKKELDWAVTIVTETDPEVAIQTVQDTEFDCIISDYDMPAMDGLAFFDAVRERDADVPFILFTGKGSEEIASQALNAGVTGYFQKGGPDQLRRLANRVRQALEDNRTQQIADRYSTVLQALGYPIYVVDNDGRFEFVNEPFAELTGYDVSTIIGSSPDLIKTDEAVEQAESELGSILSDEGSDMSQFEIDIASKEGDLIRCRDHMAALPYEGDCFEGSVGILQDISTERRLEQKLDRRRKAMDEAPIGIVMTDPTLPDNPMIYVNDRFTETTGYGREEVVGENCRFLQGPETHEASVGELRRAISDGEPTTVTLRNHTKNGDVFWNRVNLAPLRDADGNLTRWVGFQQDVTEYKQYQQQLEQQNARLEQFASVLTHDIRNPLTVAQGRLELLRDEADSDQVAEIADAHARIEQLIDDILVLLKEDNNEPNTEAVSLTETVESCWSHLDAGDVTLTTETDRAIEADPRRLRRLLTNLLGNAVDHGGETVRVGATDRGFYIADDGPGIPPAERDCVFDVGYSTADDGTGFGLVIVEEFAAAHDWDVNVSESSMGGVRFEIAEV